MPPFDHPQWWPSPAGSSCPQRSGSGSESGDHRSRQVGDVEHEQSGPFPTGEALPHGWPPGAQHRRPTRAGSRHFVTTAGTSSPHPTWRPPSQACPPVASATGEGPCSSVLGVTLFAFAYGGFAVDGSGALALAPFFVAAGVAIGCIKTAEHAVVAALAPPRCADRPSGCWPPSRVGAKLAASGVAGLFLIGDVPAGGHHVSGRLDGPRPLRPGQPIVVCTSCRGPGEGHPPAVTGAGRCSPLRPRPARRRRTRRGGLRSVPGPAPLRLQGR